MRQPDTLVEIHLAMSTQSVGVNAVDLAGDLLAEARRANERRLLVVAGDREAALQCADDVLAAIDIPISDTVAVTAEERFSCQHVTPDRSAELMGTTHTAVVLDLHGGARPNVIGRTAGAVDGGGVLIVTAPPLADWPDRRDTFDEGLVVEPFSLGDVGGAFKQRLVDCLRTHPGVGIVEAPSGTITRTGLTDPAPYDAPDPPDPTVYGQEFADEWYERCLTDDQAGALETFERLAGEPVAIVASAERGRGKSSAAGLAGAALARDGWTVGVTAPERANLRAFFARISESVDGSDRITAEMAHQVAGAGSVRYLEPLEAVERAASGAIDVLVVDEAAGLPVRTLERFLACPRVAFCTTRHGYEGSGHGFATRFRARLAEVERPVLDVHLHEPIRYAPADPIESLVNRLLLLDARPPVEEAVMETTVADVAVIDPSPAALAADPERLRSVMGLLATAHYRTEPDDLARVLDAPNLSVMGLTAGDHLVAVALIAREGDLPADRVEAAYRGERLRGNMLPDVFCGMLRDDDLAGRPGARVVRIATHPAVRRRGLGSRLLEAIRDELAHEIDWLGTGFGATPGIVRFWTANGFLPVAISASRNRASGAHSTILLDERTCDEQVIESLTRAFRTRVRDSLSDVHRSVDPAVISELLRAVSPPAGLELSAREWRGLVAAADGPGRYDHDPGPARDLAVAGLTDETVTLEERTRRVLIAKILQGRGWADVTENESFAAESMVKRAVGVALARLLDSHGPAIVERERDRLGANE